MKHFFLPGLALLLFFSCSADDSTEMQELAPVTSVSLPDTLIYDSNNEIEVEFKLRTSCHHFSGFDITSNNNSNIFVFGVTTTYRTDGNNCRESANLHDKVMLNFVAEREDFYIFKFWQGNNAAGEDQFLTIEVPITQPGNE